MKCFLLLCTLTLLATRLPAFALVEPSPTPPPAAAIDPANGKAFDPAAATQAWLDTVPAEKRAKSDAYFEGGYWLLLWDFLVTVAISIFLLQSRLSARLRDRFERLTRFKALQVFFYTAVYLLTFFVIELPYTIYTQFIREHAYGLATQSFGPWFAEQVIDLVVSTIVIGLLMIVLYAVFRRQPRNWWIWGAAVTAIFFAASLLLFPVFVAPIFNTYKEVKDPAVRDPILALARANHIPVRNVYEFDASRQTTRVSANVSGFLNTTRISLNDNLLNQSSLPEIRFVMGHEMGHYVLNHTWKLVGGFVIVAFLVGFVASRTFEWARRRWERWEVRGIADPAAMPLLVLILVVILFLLTPVNNSVSRMTEAQADAFGLAATNEPDGMAQAALKLGSYRKLNPGPLEEIIFYDHPSGRARIRMAMDWKAAHAQP